jgi:hypothetical protein
VDSDFRKELFFSEFAASSAVNSSSGFVAKTGG